MPSRKKYSCKFPKCINSYYWSKGETNKVINKRFYRFPKNPDISVKWKMISGMDVSINCRNMYICEDHFEKEDFVNFTKHMLKPNVIPKHIEIPDNLVPIQISAAFEKDPIDNNYCQPIINESAVCNDLNDNNANNINVNDTLVNNNTVSEKTPDSYDSIFTNVQVDNSDNNDRETLSGNNLTFDLTNADLTYVENRSICICDNRDCTNRKCTSNEIVETECNSVSTSTKEKKTGFLTQAGVTSKTMSPRKSIMYSIHRKTVAQLCKIKKELNNERNALKKLKSMSDENIFNCIETKLNEVTKHFIRSQLRNVNRTPCGRRWTEEDKAFALSIYKRSPRVYKYLSTYFQLPSSRTLKYILSKIPFDTGVNKILIEQLKVKSDEMHKLDRYCTLVFDEISLSRSFHYEANKKIISGFEDLGELGRTSRAANHALVLMIRGLRKLWKQVIAYYFTTDTILSNNLKYIITNVIVQLQEIGLKVKATVCDQGSTQRKAISALCAENKTDPTCYTFVVKSEIIVTIYDVPHLLKCTRNALLRCKIRFIENKEAKFKYIQNAFDVEQNFPFKLLYKLNKSDFNFKDSFVKMRVKIAARQLSHTVAAAIHSYSVSNVNGLFPVESIQTAEFVEIIDDLFDSLNGSTINRDDGKKYRCCLQDSSPHLELYSALLSEMTKWKLFDLTTGKDVTNQYHFIKGWIITISHIFVASIKSSRFQIFKYEKSKSRSIRKFVLSNSSTWNCQFQSHLSSICSCIKNRNIK